MCKAQPVQNETLSAELHSELCQNGTISKCSRIEQRKPTDEVQIGNLRKTHSFKSLGQIGRREVFEEILLAQTLLL
jgi:hypothetical protein